MNILRNLKSLLVACVLGSAATFVLAQTPWAPLTEKTWTDPNSGLTWAMCPLGFMLSDKETCTVPNIQITYQTIKDHYKSPYTNKMDPLMEIRFKTYGAMKLPTDRVQAFDTLEKMFLLNVRLEDDSFEWFGSWDLMTQAAGSIFGFDGPRASHHWTLWASGRFVPAYLAYLNAVKSVTGNSDIEQALSQLSARDEIEVITKLVNARTKSGTSIWNSSGTPYVFEDAYDDPVAVKSNIDALVVRANALDAAPGASVISPRPSARPGTASVSADTVRADGLAKVILQSSKRSRKDDKAEVAFDANGSVAAARSSQYAGFNDWRIPTRKELLSVLRCKDKSGQIIKDPVLITEPGRSALSCGGQGEVKFANGIFGREGTSYNDIWISDTDQQASRRSRLSYSSSHEFRTNYKSLVLAVRGGNPTPEWLEAIKVSDPAAVAAAQKAERAELEQRVLQREKDERLKSQQMFQEREKANAKLRANPRVGDKSLQGVIVAVRGDLVQIQTQKTLQECREYRSNGQCRVYGPRQTVPGPLVWVRRSELISME